ncbi:hypothetical protein [Algoriphagus sp. NG3]|nr:hypothetical protein [Algoriphagus sp. NG3]WPR77908.1 hypothetical protein SLW71_11175 [Algoriphagus sp. NG3]
MAEIYFITTASTRPSSKFAMSLFLGVITLGIMVGIAAATMGMWLPVI